MDNKPIGVATDTGQKFYKSMGDEVEKDFEYVDMIAEELCNAIAENRIYLLANDEVNKINIIVADIAKRKFDKHLISLDEDEDLINLRFSVGYKEYKGGGGDGFRVFYTKHQRDDVSKITVEIVESLSDYISKVLLYGEDKGNKFFYRGHGKWCYTLTPGIYRKDNQVILKNESNYIKEIISSYPQYFKECKTALDYLSVLQHNGFPTRLLDFSENPLISLYMACDNSNDYDADVVRISVPEEYFKYYDSDTVSILSNIAFAEDNLSVGNCSSNIEEFNQNPEIERFVHLIRDEKPFFEPKIDPIHLLDRVLFVKAKQDFQRISQQSGVFALFGMGCEKNKMPSIEYMNPPCNVKHFIIPKECKKQMLRDLSKININEANVYCDLEHVAKYYIKQSKIIDNKESN